MKNRKKLFLPIAIMLLFAIGILLRFIGIDWDQNHHLHPDERAISMFVGGLNFPNSWAQFFSPDSPLNPKFFAYGSFPIYLLFFLARIPGMIFSNLAFLGSYDGAALFGRVVMGIVDVGIIGMVFLVGKKFFSKKVGIIAALFSTFTVLQIQLAHFYAFDPLLTLFILLTLYFAYDIAKKPSWKPVILTGIFLGLAFGTKISVAPILLAIALAFTIPYFMSKRTKRNNPSPPSVIPAKAGIHPRFYKLSAISYKLITLLLIAFAVFAITNPYALIDFNRFIAGINEQSNMARGIADFPFTRQYIGSIPYLYQIQNSILWGYGIPLGLLAWFGLGYGIYAFFKRKEFRLPIILILAWIIPYFGITGAFHAKFLRYMLPIMPFLTILGAFALVELFTRLKFKKTIAAIGLIIFASSILYAGAFATIYFRLHSRVQASSWIYKNIPNGSVILTEHWDDDLPLGIVENNETKTIDNHQYKIEKLNIWEVDDEKKVEHIATQLSKSDYLIFTSNRGYAPILRLAKRYPITNKAYNLLFEGKLGYELVNTTTSYPNLLGWQINDDKSDESFTVYDHPKVLIFKNFGEFSKDTYNSLLSK